MIRRLYDFVCGLFDRSPVHLAIVRRYVDANGSYVGELYMEQSQGGVSSYRMIGASLDTLPLEWKDALEYVRAQVDTAHDFLATPTPNMVRVGAIDPRDNDRVRKMVARLPLRRLSLVIQNRFIEHVLENKTA